MKINLQPEIRFASFYDSWTMNKLKDFGKATAGTAIESVFTHDGCYKVVSIGSYSEDSKYVDQGIRANKNDKTKSRILNKDDLTMVLNDKTSSGRIIGRVLLIDNSNKYVYNQRTERLEVNKEKYAPIFLYHLLNSDKIRRKIISAAQGNTQIYVNWSAISELEYLIPDLGEQIQIGTFFKSLDDTIALYQQELEALNQTKQGFLQKMFPEEGMTIPEIRFSEFHEQWELKTLGEVLDSIYNGQTPSRNRKDFWNGNINWLSSGELNRGVVKTTIEKITEFGQRNANLKIVPKNTFVIAITGLEAAGTRGNCAILGMETTLNQSCMALFPKKNLLDTTFLFQWYRKVGENYGLRFTQGTKQQSYNAEIIKKLEICLPSVEEQIKIGEFFKQLDEVIELKEKELDALKETKKGFLQKMFV